MTLIHVPAELPELPRYIDDGGDLLSVVKDVWEETELAGIIRPPDGATTEEALTLQQTRARRIHISLGNILGKQLRLPSMAIPFGLGNNIPDRGLHFDENFALPPDLVLINVTGGTVKAVLARHRHTAPLATGRVINLWPTRYDSEIMHEPSQGTFATHDSLLFPTSNSEKTYQAPVGAWHDIRSAGPDPSTRTSNSYLISSGELSPLLRKLLFPDL